MAKPRDTSTVLVTGASGFIGRALAARLEAMGKTVVSVSRSQGIDVIRDDLPLTGVGHVFHLAARSGISGAWDDPAGYLDTNVLGTGRVLEQCRRHGCGVTYVSAYVYGVPARLPISEIDPIEPNNPYALSKRLAEQLCTFYSQFYGVSTVTLRVFNVYGPGQPNLFVIPHIVRQLLDPAQPEIVVMDLAPRRDYVYLSDVVEGIVVASDAEPGSVFNIGSGTAYSVEEIIQHASAAAGQRKPYRATNRRRVQEVDVTVADIRAIADAVGWRPRVSIDQGLREIVRDLRLTCTPST